MLSEQFRRTTVNLQRAFCPEQRPFSGLKEAPRTRGKANLAINADLGHSTMLNVVNYNSSVGSGSSPDRNFNDDFDTYLSPLLGIDLVITNYQFYWY
ncbi:hypothetical protein EVAR_93837_1 [Eumeta japonica]|uniref:Uncharacterized protein n=1 Tax=Eumeta variegata TaxID=151549 RepID=A0A4C1TWK0_EUMVA|nr:hypothetical protein EVAR_93837_1 [Eumeta japonica]